MAETWLTIEEVQALSGWTYRWIRMKARGGTLISKTSESRGANGKHERLYALSSLPAAAQLRYAEKATAIVVTPDAVLEKRVPQTLPLFEALPPQPPPTSLPPALEAQARERFEAIQPLLDFRARTNGNRQKFPLNDGRTVSKLDDVAAWVAAQRGISTRSLWRWYMNFKRSGYAGLADSVRRDQGQSKFFSKHPAAKAFLEGKILNEGLSAQMAWESLCREWPRLDRGPKPPCYGTVAAYVRELPDAMKTLAREGKQTYESKHAPFIQRGPVPAMEWWVADHREFDVLVRNTLFEHLGREQAYRLWLTAIYDWGSRKIVGFCLAPTPSSRTINSALRLAVLQYGFPRNFYWDNGEDFKKVRRDLEAIELSGAADGLLQGSRVQITSALPKRPRSKPIESWFARWSKRFDVLWRNAGYIGNKPGACPESGREAQAAHAAYLNGKRPSSPLPSDAEFILATIQYIDEYNAGARLEALDHRTPAEVMDEQFPLAARPQINPRALDLLFSERETRIVQRGGCVQLDRMWYEPVDASLGALDRQQGRAVLILRDPYNLGEAVAFDEEGRTFVGELRVQQFVAQCPNGQITRDQIQAAMRRQRAVLRSYTDYRALLASIASSQGWKTEREALLERAGVRTGTDAGPARLLAGAVPGARLLAAAPAPRELPASPFIDDAAREFIAAMRED